MLTHCLSTISEYQNHHFADKLALHGKQRHLQEQMSLRSTLHDFADEVHLQDNR